MALSCIIRGQFIFSTTTAMKSLLRVLLLLFVLKNADAQTGSEALYQSRWNLVQLGKTKIGASGGPRDAHLLFSTGTPNRVNGATGCNRLSGTFELSGSNRIRFAPLATTRMMCAGDRTESRFLTALKQTDRYRVGNNQLLLYRGKVLLAKFKAAAVAGSGETTDEGARINQYIRWKDQLDQGADFMAKGNEPFWSLELSEEKGMRFKTPDGTEVRTPPVSPQRLMDVAASSYRYQEQDKALTVIIYDQECRDDMSGEKFSKKVEVIINEQRYTGCGTWLSDYRLHDIWVLQRMNGQAVDPDGLLKGAPQLEINLNTGAILGHSGCNNIRGRAEPLGHRIRFSKIAGTLMACQDQGFEARYLKALQDKTFSYTFSDGLLQLKAEPGIVLEFKKVD